jgi:hypothetical protein
MFMKIRLVLLFTVFIIATSSCSVSSDDGIPVNFDVVKIESVQVPDVFRFGETHDIIVRFEKPSTCHVFSGFDVIPESNVRTIYAVSTVVSDGGCVFMEQQYEEQVYRFNVTSTGSYVFRFFAGNNDNTGEPTFIVREVPVVP